MLSWVLPVAAVALPTWMTAGVATGARPSPRSLLRRLKVGASFWS